ncbi:MAG: TonB-dependent receptor family protein [Chitinophagaceae bacterium]|nr:TonB-dependent receptor family protein [Chitinophagaceae bacterium]
MRFAMLLFVLLSVLNVRGQLTGRLPDSTGRPADSVRVRRLSSVTVHGERPLLRQQQAGVIINVENSLLSKGSSVLEVIERAPGVLVDRRNNGIALNGKEGVAVMMDGRLLRLPADQLFSLLAGLSAGDVASIELLTTPPAGYDAEGTAGIINIVLKKNRKKGDYGTVSLTGGYGVGGKAAAGVSLAHNTGKFQLSGSYNYSHDRSYYRWEAVASQNNPFLGGPNTSDVASESRWVSNSHTFTGALEAALPGHVTMGGSLNYGNSLETSHVGTGGRYIVEPDSLLVMQVDTRGRDRWNNFAGSLYASKKMGEAHTLSADADLLVYTNQSPTQSETVFINQEGAPVGGGQGLFGPRQQGYAYTNIRVGVIKADYKGVFKNGFTLETGVKFSYTRSLSLSGVQVLQNGGWEDAAGMTSDKIMHETIAAAYFSASVKIGANDRLVAGSRWEYTRTGIKDEVSGNSIVSRAGGKLFPNIFFTHKINDKEELQASYTERISRPAYNDLASFIVYDGPTSSNAGNPLLLATTSSNIKVGYVYKGFLVALIHTRDNNPIVRYQITAGPSGNIVSPQNLLYLRSFNLEALAPVRVNQWWRMQYSFTGGFRHFKENYTEFPAEKSYFAYTLNGTQTFRLPRGYGIELSGYFNSLYYNGTRRTEGYGTLNMGFKKELGGDRGTLQLAISDVFSTLRVTSYFGKLTQEAFSLKSRVLGTGESGVFPLIKLSYVRSFGKGPQASSSKDDLMDEKERVRQ